VPAVPSHATAAPSAPISASPPVMTGRRRERTSTQNR